MKHQQLFCPYWGSSAWHSRRVNERGKFRVSKTLYCRDECKALLWAPAPHNTCGSCWLGTARHISHDMRGEGWSGVTLICVPVVAPRETEDWGELNISWRLYTVLHRDILIFCAAFLREYSYICSHYVLRFTSFYATLSPGNFKVPLTLTVKKKRIVRFEGLPQFKWSDLGEQDVVGQGSFRVVFMVFDSSG